MTAANNTAAADITYSYIAESNDRSPRNDTGSIAELPDGELLAVWHRYLPGPEGASDFGAATIAACHSLDGGQSWRELRTLVDIAPGDVNVQAPALLLLPDGQLLLICLRAHARDSTSMQLYRSDDNGASFAFDRPIWKRSSGQWLQGGASCLLRLSSGRLLLPFHGGSGGQADQHNSVWCCYSDDHGATWARTEPAVDLPMRGAMEPSVAELASGELLMSLRTQLGAVFFCRSADGGQSWSLPQPANVRAPESCTCLRRLPGSDRLLLLWNDGLYDPRHHHHGIRTPLSAAVSDDNGASWRKVGDIDGGDVMLTNLGCTFTSAGTALITYLVIDDEEVEDGQYVVGARGRWGVVARHRGLRCASVDVSWFSA